MSSLTKARKFWAYDSFKKQLIVCGYIKEHFNSIPYHPLDIILLIFQYYHTFILELEYFNFDKQISTNKSAVISITETESVWVRPSTSSQWAIRSKSPINNHPLQYEFSIKCIENMSDNNVFIGIAPFNQIHFYRRRKAQFPRYCRNVNGKFKSDVVHPFYSSHLSTAYFIQNQNNCYTFWKNTNWWKSQNYQSSMKLTNRITAPINFKKNHIVSLILDCNQWKLSFLINNILINSIDVGTDCIYCPVILFRECQQPSKCKIISMKCSLNKCDKDDEYQHFDKADLNKHIFTCYKLKRNNYYWTESPYLLQSTYPKYEGCSYNTKGIKITLQSKRIIFNALYKGHKILFYDSNNLSNLIVAMKSNKCNFHLWIIIEIYMYFCDQYKEMIFSFFLNKKISEIITYFVLDNFENGYQEYNKNNATLRNLMCYKWDKWIEKDVSAVHCIKTFERWVNREILHCSRMNIVNIKDKDITLHTVGINAGINMRYKDYNDYDDYYDDYYYYDYYYYDDGNDNDEWYNNFEEYQEKHNLYLSDMVNWHFNNRHRKRKRKEKKKIKEMKKESKKQKRIELNMYVKKKKYSWYID